MKKSLFHIICLFVLVSLVLTAAGCYNTPHEKEKNAEEYEYSAYYAPMLLGNRVRIPRLEYYGGGKSYVSYEPPAAPPLGTPAKKSVVVQGVTYDMEWYKTVQYLDGTVEDCYSCKNAYMVVENGAITRFNLLSTPSTENAETKKLSEEEYVNIAKQECSAFTEENVEEYLPTVRTNDGGSVTVRFEKPIGYPDPVEGCDVLCTVKYSIRIKSDGTVYSFVRNSEVFPPNHTVQLDIAKIKQCVEERLEEMTIPAQYTTSPYYIDVTYREDMLRYHAVPYFVRCQIEVFSPEENGKFVDLISLFIEVSEKTDTESIK